MTFDGNALTRPLLRKVRETVKKYGMLGKGDSVLCAVSGGPDSMVMLHALCMLKDEYGLKLSVAHLDHGLRGAESRRDYGFVKESARRLGLRFIGRRLRPGSLSRKAKGASLQEAAREERYAFLLKAARSVKAGRIATGHTLDDQAETVLMRLIKGASTSGLGGIPPVRPPFIRPMIEVGRDEIERCAQAIGMDFVTDSSNLIDKYLRNDVRHNLIPLLKERYNPNIVEGLGRAADLLRQDDDFLGRAAEAALREAMITADNGTLVLDRGKLLVQHPAVASRAFLKCLAILGREEDAYGHDVAAFLGLIASKRPNLTIKAAGLWITRVYGRVTISAAVPVEARGFSYRLKTPGAAVVKGAGLRLKASILRGPPASIGVDGNAAYFDFDSISGRIMVRPPRPGDRMTILGMKGSKKLKDIFIDEKMPAAARTAVPVLVAGDEIIWLAGIRRCASHKVAATTRRVLKVEYLKDRDRDREP